MKQIISPMELLTLYLSFIERQDLHLLISEALKLEPPQQVKDRYIKLLKKLNGES